MNYLFLIKTNETALFSYLQPIVSEHPISIVLMQDAVYLVPDIQRLFQDSPTRIPPTVHVLQEDAVKRGIQQEIPDHVLQVNYDQLVDLLTQDNQKVLNL